VITSTGYNLSDDDTCTPYFNQTGDLNGQSLLLLPLANNGGPTQTHLPGLGSPALDAIPAGANVIDLSKLTVLPGLVDAHTHTAITYKEQPENNYYYLTYIMEPTALRAIEAASNAIQLLNSGFTVIRDVGNRRCRLGHPRPLARDAGGHRWHR